MSDGDVTFDKRELRARSELARCGRIVVKIGTNTIMRVGVSQASDNGGTAGAPGGVDAL